MTDIDIAVVGAGPAGLCAGITARRYGAKVAVFDENNAAGGQLFKQIHKFFGSKAHGAGKRGIDIGKELLAEARGLGVDIRLGAIVWGVFKRDDSGFDVCVYRDGRSSAIGSRSVIFCTGAIENSFPFPGWELPGVMTAGAAQTFTNIHRVLPGKRILMLGAGNVGLIVSHQLLQAGAEVVAVVEAGPAVGGYGVHADNLRRAGVPVLTSHTVAEALGTKRVRAARVVPSRRGRPSKTAGRLFDVDAICLAVGLHPSVELSSVTGCDTAYVPGCGGWVPLHGPLMQTSVKGVFVAGDCSGVEEASIAMEEGRVAGTAACGYTGYLGREETEKCAGKIQALLDELRSGPFGRKFVRAKDRIHNEFEKRHGKKDL